MEKPRRRKSGNSMVSRVDQDRGEMCDGPALHGQDHDIITDGVQDVENIQ